MAKDSDRRAGAAESTGGLFSSVLAEENEFDRRVLWRLGSWGFAAVAAVAIAVMASQAELGWQRDRIAAADVARQAQQIQQLARESQNEARRLTAAIDTLNNDRDRLYSRLTVVEQGLDSITGAIAKQNSPPSPAKPQQASSDPPPPAPSSSPPQAAAPAVVAVASTPAASGEKPRAETAAPEQPPSQAAAAAPVAAAAPADLNLSLVASKSMMSPPDPAAAKLIRPDQSAKPKTEASPQPETATIASPAAREAEAAEDDLPKIPAQRTEFAVDLGSAHSIGGLRALWRGLVKANPDLTALRPIIMVRESRTGAGMQLRLGAGPLLDAAAAAKICATLADKQRGCETTVFDGQRLAMVTDTKAEETPPPGTAKSPAQPQELRRKSTKRAKTEEAPPATPESPSMLSSFFGRK